MAEDGHPARRLGSWAAATAAAGGASPADSFADGGSTAGAAAGAATTAAAGTGVVTGGRRNKRPASGYDDSGGGGGGGGGGDDDGGFLLLDHQQQHHDHPYPALTRGLTDSGAGSGGEETISDSGLAAAGAADGSKKQRRVGPGSRGIANLTPEQLAKKRANDREAQRAIRERTKLRIKELQQEIRELKSQQPYQELQAALRAKEAVEAENADIKRRLASVISTIQPLLSGTTSNLTVSQSPGSSGHFSGHTAGVPSFQSVATPTSVTSCGSVEPQGQWQGTGGGLTPSGEAHTPQQQVQLFVQQRHDLVHGHDFGSERLGLEFILDPSQRQKIARIQSGPNGAQDSPRYRHVPMKHDWSGAGQQPVTPISPYSSCQGQGGTALYADYITAGGSGRFEPSFETTSRSSNYIYASISDPARATPPLLPYSVPVRNCPPTCPLDNLLLDFLHERRQRAAEGLPVHEVVGPRYPSVSSLLNPAVSRYAHPLSKVFTDILQKFPDIRALPERAAVLYVMFLMMRWQVSPTAENHARLPEWMRPLPAQLERSHPAWVDHLPFPQMRDLIARDFGHFPFDHFFIPLTSTLSVGWPYAETDVLLLCPAPAGRIPGNGDSNYGGAEEEEFVINPVFERHLRRLENWTLGDAFDDAFPALAGTYNLKSARAARAREHA